jgi:uracil-DNA glycosylase family 4
MGRIATLAMLNKNVSIAKEHGKIIEQDSKRYLITYHPAAPLYSPKVRIELENDFKMLKKLIS